MRIARQQKTIYIEKAWGKVNWDDESLKSQHQQWIDAIVEVLREKLLMLLAIHRTPRPSYVLLDNLKTLLSPRLSEDYRHWCGMTSSSYEDQVAKTNFDEAIRDQVNATSQFLRNRCV